MGGLFLGWACVSFDSACVKGVGKRSKINFEGKNKWNKEVEIGIGRGP